MLAYIQCPEFSQKLLDAKQQDKVIHCQEIKQSNILIVAKLLKLSYMEPKITMINM